MQEILISPKHRNQLWDPPSLILNGCRESWRGDKAVGAWYWQLVTI